MANTELIQKHLPQELWEIAVKFDIPDKFIESDPGLIVLILNSKSMETHEDKQSWFSLLPMMNDEQMAKLNDILTREKQKLEEIEAKYEQKKDSIKNRIIQKRENSGYQKKIEKIKTNESVIQEKEAEEAEHLLTQI